jgi:hypothetical protein
MSRKKTTLSDAVAYPGVSDGRNTACGDSVSNVEPHAGDLKTQRWSEQAALPASGVYGQLLDDLAAVIAPLEELHRQAVESHSPTVWEILRTGSRDIRLIEHSLDCLLDHACIPEGLALFKSLCRHYWQIDPHATAAYINAYREMWDSDDHETEEPEVPGDLPNDPEINS